MSWLSRRRFKPSHPWPPRDSRPNVVHEDFRRRSQKALRELKKSIPPSQEKK